MTKELILEIVSNASGQPMEKIIGQDRYRPILIARQIYIYFLRKKLKMTYQHIGKILDRDHTTIIHSVSKVDELLEVGDEPMTTLYDQVDLSYQYANQEPHRLLVEISKDENINDAIFKIMAATPCKVSKF